MVQTAALSELATLLLSRLKVCTNVSKDDVVYPDSFTGAEAVTVLTEIVKSSDRNLALLLARALEVQGFIVEATSCGQHRVRDRQDAIYRFGADVEGVLQDDPVQIPSPARSYQESLKSIENEDEDPKADDRAPPIVSNPATNPIDSANHTASVLFQGMSTETCTVGSIEAEHLASHGRYTFPLLAPRN